MTEKPTIDPRPTHNKYAKANERIISISSTSGSCLISAIETGNYLLLMLHGIGKKTIIRIGQIPRDKRGQRTKS